MNILAFVCIIWLAANHAFAAEPVTGCDATCQFLANQGSTFETGQHADANLTFYKVPSNFSRSLAPGTVLSVEYDTDPSNYLVPSSLTMSRIIYTTTDLNGTVQPASAYILWPYVQPGNSGFPAVAWAHGTAGNFPACAPSNYKALQYHFMVPFALALQGIAVIAPDYAGLGIGSLPDGTPVPHAYTAAPAQANDLANALIAARAAFPADLASDGPFVAAGHSQGGGVSWAFAERQAQQPVAGYRGTISFSPAARVIPWITEALAALDANMLTAATNATLATQNKVISGITAVYPQYNFSGMTAAGYDIWHNGLGKVQGCLPTDSLLQFGIPPLDLVHRNWTEDPTVQEYAKRTNVGGRSIAGPMMVLIGEIDIVSVADVEAVVDDTCQFLTESNSTAKLEFITYGQANHFPLIQASQHHWMGWIKDRLSGTAPCKTQPTCKKSFVEGFRSNRTMGVPEGSLPNWLVTGVAPSLGWEYAL